MFRRPHRRPASRADDEAHIEGEGAHAWWSERDGLERRPQPKPRGAAARQSGANEASASGFRRYNTNESLYERNRLRTVDAVHAAFMLLGIEPTDDPKTISLAYRAKAKDAHPDNGGDETTMIELNQAYATLREFTRS